MKRPLDSAPDAIRSGAFKPLPQLSTARTLEALAAGSNGQLQALAPGPNAAPLAVRPVMCKFYLKKMCAKGKYCAFSHEADEMQDVPLEQKARSICKFFDMGLCNRGGACKFPHGEEELFEVLNLPKTKSRREDGSVIDEEAEIVEDVFSKSIQIASGFQSFDSFDAANPNVTEVAAGGSQFEQAMDEGGGVDEDLFASFLAEVGGGDEASGKEPGPAPIKITAASPAPKFNIQMGNSSGSTSSPIKIQVKIPSLPQASNGKGPIIISAASAHAAGKSGAGFAKGAGKVISPQVISPQLQDTLPLRWPNESSPQVISPQLQDPLPLRWPNESSPQVISPQLQDWGGDSWGNGKDSGGSGKGDWGKGGTKDWGDWSKGDTNWGGPGSWPVGEITGQSGWSGKSDWSKGGGW